MTYKADIGIIGALADETSELISLLDSPVCEKVGGVDFYFGKMFDKAVVIARCGVGKVFAALCAEAMIIRYSPSLIVNTGVGGALDRRLRPCDIVFADRTVQHDMDTSPLGDPKGLVSGINKVYFECDRAAVSALSLAAERLGINYLVGTVASGDKFIADREDKERIVSEFGAVACEMEGAAIAQVAYVNSVPCAVIRAISDSADGDASMDYPAFLPIAVKTSFSLTLELVKTYAV